MAAKRKEIMAKLAAVQALQNGAKPSGSSGLKDAMVNVVAPAQPTPAKSKTEKLKNLADPSKDSPRTAEKRAEIMAKVAAAKAKPAPAAEAKAAKQTAAPAQPTPAKSKTEKLKNLADPSKDSPRTAEKRAEIMAKVAAAKAKPAPAASTPACSGTESTMPVGEYVTAQGQLQHLLARTTSLERSEGEPMDAELRALRAACALLRNSVKSQLR